MHKMLASLYGRRRTILSVCFKSVLISLKLTLSTRRICFSGILDTNVSNFVISTRRPSELTISSPVSTAQGSQRSLCHLFYNLYLFVLTTLWAQNQYLLTS